MGSRVMAGELEPDAILAVDVNHDYKAAPGVGDKKFNPQEMGKGFTLSVGSIASEQLNAVIEQTAKDHDIPMQRDVVGADTGTDGMAGVLASVDCAATSIGFPIRNMHTISETGNTKDVLAAAHAVAKSIQALDQRDDGREKLREQFRNNHPRLDTAEPLRHQGSEKPKEQGKED
jgi:endoglucanase